MPASLPPDQAAQENQQIHSPFLSEVGEAGEPGGLTQQAVEIIPGEKHPTSLFDRGITFFHPSVVSNLNNSPEAQADNQLTDKTNYYLNCGLQF